MENEEIMVVEEAFDSPVEPEGLCCFLIFSPFRS